MTVVRRGLATAVLCLLALATGSARAERSAPQGELRRGGRRAEPEAAARTTRWLAGRARQTHAHRRGPGARRGEHRVRDSRLADPLALPPRRERDGRRRTPLAARPARVAAGRRAHLPERALPLAARPQLPADRRADALGRRARERRPGDEDRDHRRGNRPDAPVLRACGLHDAGGLSEGPDRLHDGEGDRRARLPAGAAAMEARREALRPRALVARHARRGDRGRQREHPRGRHAHLRRRAARVPRQLQGADDPDRRGRRARRQLAGARRRDRGRSRRRHGRDQHVARRAGDRAVAATSSCARSRRRPRRASSRSSRPATTTRTSAAARSAPPAPAPAAITVGAVTTSRSGPTTSSPRSPRAARRRSRCS